MGQATIFMGFVQRDDNYTTLGALLAGQTKLSASKRVQQACAEFSIFTNGSDPNMNVCLYLYHLGSLLEFDM